MLADLWDMGDEEDDWGDDPPPYDDEEESEEYSGSEYTDETGSSSEYTDETESGQEEKAVEDGKAKPVKHTAPSLQKSHSQGVMDQALGSWWQTTTTDEPQEKILTPRRGLGKPRKSLAEATPAEPTKTEEPAQSPRGSTVANEQTQTPADTSEPVKPPKAGTKAEDPRCETLHVMAYNIQKELLELWPGGPEDAEAKFKICKLISQFAINLGFDRTWGKGVDYRGDDDQAPRSCVKLPGGSKFVCVKSNFSFTGKCRARFRIQAKRDEMWIGVAANPERIQGPYTPGIQRGGMGQWSYYGGRTLAKYPAIITQNGKCFIAGKQRQDIPSYWIRMEAELPRQEFLQRFRPTVNGMGLADAGLGCYHFPAKTFLHRLAPFNTGDTVEVWADVPNGIFACVRNGRLQASTRLFGGGHPTPRAHYWGKRLFFFVAMSSDQDGVQFELMDWQPPAEDKRSKRRPKGPSQGRQSRIRGQAKSPDKAQASPRKSRTMERKKLRDEAAKAAGGKAQQAAGGGIVTGKVTASI